MSSRARSSSVYDWCIASSRVSACMLLTRMCSILRNLTKNRWIIVLRHLTICLWTAIMMKIRRVILSFQARADSFLLFVCGIHKGNSFKECDSLEMFCRDAIGNCYDIIREHAALILSDTRYPESRILDRISVEKVLHNMIVILWAMDQSFLSGSCIILLRRCSL